MESYEQIGGDAAGVQIEEALRADYAAAHAPFAGFGAWFYRTCYDAMTVGAPAAIAKHRAEWVAILGGTPAPVPPPAPSADMIADVTYVGGPNIGAWPITTRITRLELRLTGVHVEFSKQDGPGRWPDAITPGWAGPLEYSLGLVLRVNGRWYAAAPIELWHDLQESGGPIQAPDQIRTNWFYDARWSPLDTHQPVAGEELGLFVCAGDARNNANPVKERSQIVRFRLPEPNSTAVFTYEN